MAKYRRSLYKLLQREFPGGPLVGAEIGVWKAGTSAKLLKELPGLRLMLVDIWERGHGGGTVNYSVEKMSKCHDEAIRRLSAFPGYRYEVIWESSTKASKTVEDGSLDFVFIDGSHKAEDVEEDLRCWVRKVKGGGLAIGHDYLGLRHKESEVRIPVDEFVEEDGHKLEYIRKGDIWWFRK